MKSKMTVVFLLLFILHSVFGINSYLQPPSVDDSTHKFYSSYNTATVNSIRNEMMRILEMDKYNKTLENQLTSMFDLNNPNPSYMFILPGGSINNTIILRKSDFTMPTYPNVTGLRRYQTNLKRSNFYVNVSPHKQPEPEVSQIRHEDLTPSILAEFKSSGTNYGEPESVKIVAENVRTERNFVKFMDDLNNQNAITVTDSSDPKFSKLPQSERLIRNKKVSKSKQIINQYEFEYDEEEQIPKPKVNEQKSKDEVGWSEFGLDGWTGGLTKFNVNYPPEDPSSKTVETHQRFSGIQKGFVPIQTGIDFLSYLKTDSTSTRKDKSLQVQKTTPISYYEQTSTVRYPHHKYESGEDAGTWEIEPTMSKELLNILEEENGKMWNLTGDQKTFTPKWPVTSMRGDHHDDDIFIARANNPFGHSTKWIKRNSSDVSYNEIGGREGRAKRGVPELYSMIKCATGCDPLIYKGYGCYCGFLGDGNTLDGIDRCCKMHDYCYATSQCPAYLEYFVPYLWKCYRGKPLCAISNGQWGGPGSCSNRLCECDQALARCLRRFYCPRRRAVCRSSPWRLLQNYIMDFPYG